jgi:hypothetical protein
MKERMKARERMEKGKGTTCKNGIPLFARLGVDIGVLQASLSSGGGCQKQRQRVVEFGTLRTLIHVTTPYVFN